jgi:hypothetical protein
LPASSTTRYKPRGCGAGWSRTKGFRLGQDAVYPEW